MTIQVRLFAALRELAGASRVDGAGRNAGEVADGLSATYGERFAAIRTRETLGRVLPGLGHELIVRIEPSVYSFEADQLLELLREVPADVGSVMLIGHNPAMQELASVLAAEGDRLDDLRKGFPTAALAELDLPIGSWDELRPGSGRLERFVVPRALDPG